MLCAAISVGSGCARNDRVISWDLSTSNTARDVDFDPTAEVDGTVIEGVESIRIELPDDRIFEADTDIHDVTIGTQGEKLQLVAVEFQPQSVEDAYRRAVALAEEWDIPTANIDKWYRIASRPNDDLTTQGLSGSRDVIGGPGGPRPYVELRPFDEDAPALVSFQFQWRM
jgi:hypothetical protein